jgi:hypothetical protein
MNASATDIFFDWRLFLPQRTPIELFTQGIHSTGDLSAAFIWLIIAVVLTLTLWISVRGLRALSAIAFLRKILRQADASSLPRLRRDLRQYASKRRFEGSLWRAFDASWIESADGKALYQSADVSEFFNPHTLSGGLAGNRLLAAMPGILTALGILGTFVGLQIGLSSLDLGSPQVLSQSIVPLIQGAAVAFATSVWGTVASVFFNLLEKSLEQMLYRRIHLLQHQASALFSPHVAEQTLLNIERANVEAENALKGLAEQIGAHMQKALLEVPQHIQSGIEAAMQPAIERLVDAAESLARKQGDSASEALTEIIQRFVDSVGQSGEHSRQGLESASDQLSRAISQWSGGMEGFLQRLDTRATDFDSHIGALLTQGKELRQEAGVSQQFLANVAGELHHGSELLNNASKNLATLGSELNKAVQILGEHQTQAAKLTEAVAKKQQETAKLLHNIALSLEQANDGLRISSESLRASAQLAGEGLAHIREAQEVFLDGIKKTLNTLRKQVGEMMSDYATDVEEQTKTRLEQWNIQTQAFSTNMVTAVTAMNDILGEIDSALARRRE